MKVSTDSCIFGAIVAEIFAEKGCHDANYLDIGTGTGLLSLMIAQKTPAFIDAVEIDHLRATGLGTGKSQALLAGQAIQQTGLSYIAPSQEGDFGQRLRWKLVRPGRTCDVLGLNLRWHRLSEFQYAGSPAGWMPARDVQRAHANGSLRRS